MPGHQKQCAALKAKKEKESLARASIGGARVSHHPRRPPPLGGRSSFGGGCDRGGGKASQPCSPPASTAPRRARATSLGGSQSVPAPPPPSAKAQNGIAFTPPSRVSLQASTSSRSTAELPAAGDAALQCSDALVSKGYISLASEEVEEALQLQLAERIPGAELVGAYKVNERSHSSMYDALRTAVQEQHGGESPLERELWHGTAWAIIPKILRQGFNRSFAGRHGTLLGVATYFSADLAYSQRFCDRRGGGKNNTKVVLLSRVLVGKYCKGAPSDVEPPVRDAETGERYDSTVDSEERPGIFAVFRDFQAVPLFLLEFRSGATAAATA